jgi:hypothetical protein
MRSYRLTVGSAVFAGIAGFFSNAGWLVAQQGVTLQLPTFSSFRVATTVVVPDRGGAYLGGAGSSRSGRSGFGTLLAPGRTPFGGGQGSAGVQVGARIHDMRSMDESIRRADPKTLIMRDPLVRDLAAAQAPARTNSGMSLQEIESQRAKAAAAEQADAADLLQRGRQAQAAGKSSLARTYYQVALRLAKGDLRAEIAALLAGN